MKNNRQWRKAGVILAVIGLCLTIAGLIWAASAQNQKLETTSLTLVQVKVKADNNENALIEMKADIHYIKKAVERIEKKVE